MPTIGIDIGGSKIRAILWSGRSVVQAREFSTPKNGAEFRNQICGLLPLLSRRKPGAIGIGAAGIVKGAVLLFSPNIRYIKKYDFRSLWPRSIAVRVDNDARAFARAELLRGAGRGTKSIFALTIGTGIGRAYGENKKIIRIKRLEYPEPWEREYQALRDTRDTGRLAEFLGQRLAPLIKPYRPEVIVVGGGVIRRRGFLRLFQAALGRQGVRATLKRASFRDNGVAIGAALLFGR
jgi:predicted NBD/HSP70 family sugar kinase